MITLSKVSYPGWSIKFATEGQAARELGSWICGDCLQELPSSSPYDCSLDELLSTVCGLEFMVDCDE